MGVVLFCSCFHISSRFSEENSLAILTRQRDTRPAFSSGITVAFNQSVLYLLRTLPSATSVFIEYAWCFVLSQPDKDRNMVVKTLPIFRNLAVCECFVKQNIHKQPFC